MQLNLSGHKLGNYTLNQLLGAGGMASVYASYQETVKRPVAIKILPPQLALTPGYSERFLREVELAASLEHPHILPIYDYGTDQGMSYIVMRLLTGGSLDARIREFGKPSISEALQILRQIGDALDYAHRRGIIHRDLKSSNVMFDAEGNAYLADFGIAKALDSHTTGLTGTGQVVGTPSYMSPEQWRGESVDGRADIYAFGVMSYDLLTGRMPFSAPTPHAMMFKHLTEQAPPPAVVDPSLPPAVNDILGKALAKDPQDRYATASAFVQELERVIKAHEHYQVQHTGFLKNALMTKPSVYAAPKAPNASLEGPTVSTPGIPTRPTHPDVTPTTLARTGPGTASRQALPQTVVNESAIPTRRTWGWPLLALGAVVLLALVIGGIFLASQSSDDPTPTASSGVVESEATSEATELVTEEATLEVTNEITPEATEEVAQVSSATPTQTHTVTTRPSETPTHTHTVTASLTATSSQTVTPTQTASLTATATQNIAATQTAQANATQTANTLIQQAIIATQNAFATQTASAVGQAGNGPTRTPAQVADNASIECAGLRSRLRVNEYASVLTEPPDPNVIRSGPTTNSRRIGLIQPGESFLVLEGPICADDIIWWRVQTANGQTGWTGEGRYVYWTEPSNTSNRLVPQNQPRANPLIECPNAPVTQLAIGAVAIVDFNQGGSLLVTRSPLGLGTDADTLIEIEDGGRLLILNGPICGRRGDRLRWLVRDEASGIEGWASEGLENDRWMCPASNPECGN